MSIIGDGIDLLRLVNKAQNADLYKQLGEWIDKVGELQKQTDELKAERDALKEKLRVKATLERVNGHLYIQSDDEEICSRCAEVDHLPVHLITVHSARPPYQSASCPSCKTTYMSGRPIFRSELKR